MTTNDIIICARCKTAIIDFGWVLVCPGFPAIYAHSECLTKEEKKKSRQTQKETTVTLIDWRNFSKELRIHMAHTQGHADLDEATRDYEEINADPNKWARMEYDISDTHRVVKVTWGIIHSNGDRECALQTTTYTLVKDGSVVKTHHTHP